MPNNDSMPHYEIPLLTHAGEGQLLVLCAVNGVPIICLFDTGAPQLFYVETRTAEVLGLPVIDMTFLQIAHRNLSTEVPVYYIDRLELGNLVYENIHALGLESGRADGLLGLGIVQGKSFCVDNYAKRLYISCA